MDAALGTAVLATLGIIAAIDAVWMGLALGALLRKLGGSPFRAWVPVLRWVAAAREGRVPTVPVAEARSVEFAGAVVAVVSWVAMLVTEEPVPAARTALIVGLLMWLIGGLAGWLMWIDGASTIELRMRAPRAMTWLAAIAPAVWASVLGWGSYQATGHGVTANAAAAGAASVHGREPRAASDAPQAVPAAQSALRQAEAAASPPGTSPDPAPARGDSPAWVTGDGGATVAQRWEGFGEGYTPAAPRASFADGQADGDEFPVDLGPGGPADRQDEPPVTGHAPGGGDTFPGDVRAGDGDATERDSMARPTDHADSDGAASSASAEDHSSPDDSVPSEPTAVTPLPPGWTGAWAKVADDEPRPPSTPKAEPSDLDAAAASDDAAAFDHAVEFPDVGDAGPGGPGAGEDLPAASGPASPPHQPLAEHTDADAPTASPADAPAVAGSSAPDSAPGPVRDGAIADTDDAVVAPSPAAPPAEPSPATAAVPRVPPPSAASPYVRRLSPYLQPEPSAASPDPTDTPEGASSADTEASPTDAAPVSDAAGPTGPVAPSEPAPTTSTLEVRPLPGDGDAKDAEPTQAPPATPARPATASAAGTDGLEGAPIVSPLPPPPPARADSAQSAGTAPDDDDHTIIAERRRDAWMLEVEGGASYGLGAESVVIGRSTSVAIPGRLGVDDPTRTLSKLHAELEPREGRWWVRDLGSTNGTYLRAEDGTEREVGERGSTVDGDLILGDLVVRIVRLEERR
ncbi:FHA domain-containing protein [Demequina sp. SO4-18]|uniref:FHA domain-containing protein n=1 Tax=Demequina sp. SO4-18 TaxID=3401026 RepID=UPI003B5BE641